MARLLAMLDSFITWIERVNSTPWGRNVMLAAVTIGLAVWQRVIGLPLALIIPLAIITFAALLYLVLNLPVWLNRIRALPFAVTVPMIGQTDDSLQVMVVVQNRQDVRRLTLHLEFCSVAVNGMRSWYQPNKFDGIELDLGGDAYSEGMVRCDVKQVPDLDVTHWLMRISDMVSGRSAMFPIPGSGPGGERLRWRSGARFTKTPKQVLHTKLDTQATFNWKEIGGSGSSEMPIAIRDKPPSD